MACRMCKAKPGKMCKYKGKLITRCLGGHNNRTPLRDQKFHHMRVADANLADLLLKSSESASRLT